MKEIKVEWCENWIRAQFTKHHAFPGPTAGIERNLMFRKAAAAGLYIPGTYGSPFSVALGNVCTIDAVHDADGNFCYHVFRLAAAIYKEYKAGA